MKSEINLYRDQKRKKMGSLGENLSCRFLERSGFKIIARNWRNGHDEIDIIAIDGDILVFVEVRLRKSNALVNGYQSISTHKKEALRRACESYLEKFASDVATYRFDVIDVEYDYGTETSKINHFENVSLF